MYWCKTKKVWVISWQDPRRKGKCHYKRMPKGTKKEIAKKQEVLARSGQLDIVEYKKEKNFEDWSESWIEQYAQIHKTQSSVIKDRSTLRNHLLPRFADWYISAIDVAEVQRLQSDLVERHLAPQTINNVIACLSMILNFAVNQGALRLNPCKLVKRIKSHQKPPAFWSFEEVDKFMSYCRNRDFSTFQLVALVITTGLRPGEVQGLLRDCLDFENGFVHVKRNYCTKTHQILDYTKTKRDRKVPVPTEVLSVLQNKYHLPPQSPIFDFSCNSFGKRKIQRIAKECGVRPIRFHDLRHTFASHLAIKNVHQVKIRDLLGHTKLDTTNIYMHLSHDDKKGLTDVLTSGMRWTSGDSQCADNVINFHR